MPLSISVGAFAYSVHLLMKPPKAPRPDQDELPPKWPRLEEARRIIEEYAVELRELIKKLQRKLN